MYVARIAEGLQSPKKKTIGALTFPPRYLEPRPSGMSVKKGPPVTEA